MNPGRSGFLPTVLVLELCPGVPKNSVRNVIFQVIQNRRNTVFLTMLWACWLSHYGRKHP